ncbi:MAG: hypothetical protein HY834_00380 [Devosia nanyangense]|uniref:Uncharacterized protein n=1 Tax=Devosia nanyangense TaxID=1228055 RepID=A0A933KZV5_9HYPH|nr:hypothetical protein [Devosia nanyangense]
MAEMRLDEYFENVIAAAGTILGSKKPSVAPPEPPSVKTVLWDRSLYDVIPYDLERDLKWLETLKFGQIVFDGHCPHCGKDTTFRSMTDQNIEVVAGLKARPVSQTWAKKQATALTLDKHQFARHLVCQRNGHLLSYVFIQGPWAVVKIGQYPSIEDLAAGQLERYRKTLEPAYFKELHRANGLFAHGVGIGAFVYLRRIFERLIEKHRTRIDPDHRLFANFDGIRMEDKIALLKEELPETVVKNRVAYSILSKGLHSLSEDECRTYFPAVRAAIVLMLEQDYEAEQKRIADKAAEDEIAALNAKLGGRTGGNESETPKESEG